MLTQQQFASLSAALDALAQQAAGVLDLSAVRAQLQAQAPVTITINEMPLNASDITCISTQYETSRYERYQKALILTAAAINQKFGRHNQAAGGTLLALSYPSYAWSINGADRAFYTRKSTETTGYLVGDLGDTPDGDAQCDLYGVAADGTHTLLSRYFGLVHRNASVPLTQDTVVAQNCSRDWESQAAAGFTTAVQYAAIPRDLYATTRVQPLTMRAAPAFNTALPMVQITRINVVPMTEGVPHHRLAQSAAAEFTTAHRQFYFYDDMTGAHPCLPRVSGPRGIGIVSQPSALHPTRNYQTYFCETDCFGKVMKDGSVVRFFGREDVVDPLWTEVQAGTVTRGFASGQVDAASLAYLATLPDTFPGPRESWVIIVDPASLTLDTNAQPIGDPPEQPHVGSPRIFLLDRRGFGWVGTFNGHDRSQPSQWAIVLKGLTDPWGAALDPTTRTLYVAERMADRISMWNFDTFAPLGNFLGTVGLGLGALDGQRVWQPKAGVTLATIRMHDCVAPEGLTIDQATRRLYFGSQGMRELRGKSLDGGPVQVACRPQADNNSNYFYIDHSDGQFGPAGALGVTSWSVLNNGRPQLFLPTAGIAADGTPLTHSVVWKWQGLADRVIQGPGGKWDADSYATAFAMGYKGGIDQPQGVMWCGDSEAGLAMYCQYDATLDGPLPTASDYTAAQKGGEHYRRYFQILHGPGCNGPDIELPWGQGIPEMDTWMQRFCHFDPPAP